MLVTIDLSQLSGISSTGSTLNLSHQDGTSPGTLTSLRHRRKGSHQRRLRQRNCPHARADRDGAFPQPAGALAGSATTTSRRGSPRDCRSLPFPGTFGAGTLRAGALEQSNTDIGKNLVDLIVASTNYQGNARVISSVDQLVNVLLTLGR